MEKMTVDELRNLLTYLEENYSLAYDGGAFGLADALRDKINGVFKFLLLKIHAENPYQYNTDADIRYFEGV